MQEKGVILPYNTFVWGDRLTKGVYREFIIQKAEQKQLSMKTALITVPLRKNIKLYIPTK